MLASSTAAATSLPLHRHCRSGYKYNSIRGRSSSSASSQKHNRVSESVHMTNVFVSSPSLFCKSTATPECFVYSIRRYLEVILTCAARGEFPDDSNDVSGAHLSASQQAIVRRKKALEQLDEQLLEDVKPPYVEYLMGLGLDPDDIRKIVGRYPCIRHRSVDGEIRPFVEVLQNVGVDHEGSLVILCRWPQALAVNIEKKFLPTMEYLESLGMDKARSVKVIRRFPQLLTLTRENIEEKVSYFLELGITTENVQKMFALSPHIFGMAIEKKFRPTTEFFLDKGFTIEEFQTMVVKFPSIYNFSVTKSLIPKWEFFLEMGYPTSILVRFPQYFSYSLEGRIKLRHKLAKEHGVRLHPIRLLNTPNRSFGSLLKMLGSRSVKDGG